MPDFEIVFPAHCERVENVPDWNAAAIEAATRYIATLRRLQARPLHTEIYPPRDGCPQFDAE